MDDHIEARNARGIQGGPHQDLNPEEWSCKLSTEPISCPCCRSTTIARDSAGVWLFLFSWLIPPFTWLLFLLNQNVWCTTCGVRFRK